MNLIVIYFLLLVPVASLGQIRIYNQSLNDTSSKQLYQGYSNKLIVETQEKGEIILKGNHSSIYPINENEFEAFPSSLKSETILIYQKGKLVHTSTFKVLPINNLMVRVGNMIDTVLSSNQILLNPFLNVIFPQSNYRGDMRVISFSILVLNENGDIISIEKCLTNRIPGTALNDIKRIKSGSQLKFENIIGGGPGSRLIKLPEFLITIK